MSNSEGGMTELKSCPFCGSAPLVHETDWNEPPTWSVLCMNGECGGSRASRDEAVTAWNRRSPSPDAEAARREAIEEAAKVADAEGQPYSADDEFGLGYESACSNIAAAIRALSPPVEGE